MGWDGMGLTWVGFGRCMGGFRPQDKNQGGSYSIGELLGLECASLLISLIVLVYALLDFLCWGGGERGGEECLGVICSSYRPTVYMNENGVQSEPLFFFSPFFSFLLFSPFLPPSTPNLFHR